MELPFRIISTPPAQRQPPDGWGALPLAVRLPPDRCYSYGFSDYEATLVNGQLTARPIERRRQAKLPQALAGRLSPNHARYATHVFEQSAGWLVMFDHGEFGGGLEWYDRKGGEPRAVQVGPRDEDEVNVQNVNQAVADGSTIYVLQGLSHLGISEGRLAKVWREHEHFTSHVIARYDSEPVAWIPGPDGFLIATWEAIWITKLDGSTTLVARLPGIMRYPTSLARGSDGTLYVGTRGGVLRLTPTWSDEPRYAADYLWPQHSGMPNCAAPENNTE